MAIWRVARQSDALVALPLRRRGERFERRTVAKSPAWVNRCGRASPAGTKPLAANCSMNSHGSRASGRPAAVHLVFGVAQQRTDVGVVFGRHIRHRPEHEGAPKAFVLDLQVAMAQVDKGGGD